MKTAVVDLQYKKNNKYMKKKAFCLFPKKNKINNIWAIHFCKKIEKIIGTSMYPRAKFKKKKKKARRKKVLLSPKKRCRVRMSPPETNQTINYYEI